MSALPSSNGYNDLDDTELFLADFHFKYGEHLDFAREAAKTTATPAWQSMYTAQQNAHREVNRNAIKLANEAFERIRNSDSNEDDEKAVKDALKTITEERVRFDAWDNRTVYPLRQSVEECRRIKENAIRGAIEDERQNTLVMQGLADRVRKIVATWPVPIWNADAGVVTVETPETK